MNIVARSMAGCMLLLTTGSASPQAPLPAQSPAPAGELYAADVHEAPAELGLSSTIELKPNGRFEWRFTMRRLTLSARGEWDRGGGMIHLSNPEQVGEPTIELAGAARDAAAALCVRLEPVTARMASALEVELEYPDDRLARIPLADGEVCMSAGERRPIAVRLTSESISFRTQPIAVAPGGDNVLILRLTPADLGQAFFGSQQTRFDGRGMTLDWRGVALRYDRVPAR